MLTILRVHLPSEIPIVGCELTPYVLVKRPDGSVSSADIMEFNPVAGHFLIYKWYRIESDKKDPVCSVHPAEQATLQCLACIKAKLPISKSYHCTSKCFSDAWQHHRVLHERAAVAANENNNVENYGQFNRSTSGAVNNSMSQMNLSLSNVTTAMYPAVVAHRKGSEIWFEVGRSKTYSPTADDIGHALKFECVVIDARTKLPFGVPTTLTTSHVIPAPSPTPRRMISVGGIDIPGHSELENRSLFGGTFTVLSYNILSEAYTTSGQYNYCPSWALAWTYRKQNLLREIVGYRADIVCLQEVQSGHYEDFFAPELDKHGYHALFKKRSVEVFGVNVNIIDGCATFFRRDKFSHVKKYEVEFNKAAQTLTDALVPSAPKKAALNRLNKDNISLIVVLEAKFNNQSSDIPGRPQLVCVANTHINVPQELKDVKIWQVHTLLKGLEKIAASTDIPMLVCGDFNSVPGSAPHALLAMGKVPHLHPDLFVDPLGLLRPATKLTHQLTLVSAYTAFGRAGSGLPLEQRRKIDPATNEPLFTTCTRDFIGTSDYIFYSADTLSVESVLELLDEEGLRKNTALPSPEWSSDHIALLAQFRCKLKSGR